MGKRGKRIFEGAGLGTWGWLGRLERGGIEDEKEGRGEGKEKRRRMGRPFGCTDGSGGRREEMMISTLFGFSCKSETRADKSAVSGTDSGGFRSIERKRRNHFSLFGHSSYLIVLNQICGEVQRVLYFADVHAVFPDFSTSVAFSGF